MIDRIPLLLSISIVKYIIMELRVSNVAKHCNSNGVLGAKVHPLLLIYLWILVFIIDLGQIYGSWNTSTSSCDALYATPLRNKKINQKKKEAENLSPSFHKRLGYKFLFHVKPPSIHARLLLWTARTPVIHQEERCNWFSMELGRDSFQALSGSSSPKPRVRLDIHGQPSVCPEHRNSQTPLCSKGAGFIVSQTPGVF